MAALRLADRGRCGVAVLPGRRRRLKTAGAVSQQWPQVPRLCPEETYSSGWTRTREEPDTPQQDWLSPVRLKHTFPERLNQRNNRFLSETPPLKISIFKVVSTRSLVLPDCSRYATQLAQTYQAAQSAFVVVVRVPLVHPHIYECFQTAFVALPFHEVALY